MKFGIREIANVVFKAKTEQKIGNMTFKQGQPVFYLDTAKTSSMEGAATTVYATGGRGNVRLVAWEGQRTLTFTVEDALISPISFAMLSGAGLVKSQVNTEKVHFHQTTATVIDANGYIDLTDALAVNDTICSTAPLYVMEVDKQGDLTGVLLKDYTAPGAALTKTESNKLITIYSGGKYLSWQAPEGSEQGATIPSDYPDKSVIVDYYVIKDGTKVSELQIDMQHFGGYYYVEADTLFRNTDGKDYPANLTFPNVKIQSNFTFSMAATGDPSTFTFTMDAFPGYTYFEPSKKVLCAIQIADENADLVETKKSVFPHNDSNESYEESTYDSSPSEGKSTAQG